MSRAALEVERQVKAMKAESARSRKAPKPTQGARTVQDVGSDKKDLTSDTVHDMTDLSSATEAGTAAESGNNVAEGAVSEGKEDKTVEKKKGGGKKKAAKAAKAPKAAKTAKTAKAPAERKSRVKVVSGALKKIEAMGGTYLKLEFEEGHIVLTPTSNREANRDLAVKSLRALLK